MMERSKNVLASWSKTVSTRERRSSENDVRNIAKMRSFRVGSVSGARSSLVGTALPSLTTPISVPVWSLTGDTMTAVAATVALLIAEPPAVAFTFNLTPDAIATALASPTGFLDSLKRSFDLELKKVLKGVSLPYWFCIDINDDGRLHIHGAFLAPAANLPMVRRIRKIMKAAWGEWKTPGKRKQLRFWTLYSDGWASLIAHIPHCAKSFF
jgi:hypothetical protein